MTQPSSSPDPLADAVAVAGWPGCTGAGSYTQKLWMRVKRKAAYLPG